MRRQIPTRPFVSEVVEQLVGDYRAAHRAGHGVDARVGLVGRRLCLREEKWKRAERLSPKQIARVSVHRVRARRRDRVVHHPHRLPELGCVSARDHLHFADHHLGHRQEPQTGAIFLGVRVAVDLVVDAHQRTVRREPRHAELGVLETGNAGLREREVVRIAGDERQVLHLDLAQIASRVDLRRVEYRPVARVHGNELADLSDREGGVDDRCLPRRELDVRLFVFLESGQLRDDAVRAEWQELRAIQPVLVRDDRAFGTGFGVRHRDGDAGQHSTRRVDNGAFDGAVGRL